MNTTWIYKRKDIDGIYQSIIAKYIAKGYRIITSHSNGTQGELAKIDFTDGTSIYRIWYDDDSERFNDELYTYTRYLLISVRKYIVNKEDLYNSSYTLWFDKGEIVEEKKFYLINEYTHHWRTDTSKQAYVSNATDAIALIKKSQNRYISDEIRIKINLSKEDKKRIIDIIKTHHSRGYSTLKLKDIDYLERIYDTRYKNGRNQYHVIFSKDYKEHDIYLKSLH